MSMWSFAACPKLRNKFVDIFVLSNNFFLIALYLLPLSRSSKVGLDLLSITSKWCLSPLSIRKSNIAASTKSSKLVKPPIFLKSLEDFT
jgi:hypothetical protein